MSADDPPPNTTLTLPPLSASSLIVFMDVNAGEIAGAPGMGLGFAMLTRTNHAIKNVKVYRRQCEGVARQCRELLVSLQDSGRGLEGEQALVVADEIAAIIQEVEGRVAKWAEFSYLKSFLLQNDIQAGLEEMERRIQTAGLKFSLKIGMETMRFNIGMRDAQKTDQMELRDLLVRIVKDVDDIKKLVTLESPTCPVVERVMESLQTELMAPDLKPTHETAFKNGLWMLHQKTQKLPPLTDLTGQVELTSRYRIAAGAHNDVYSGLWLGNEKVALRLPRLLPGSRGVHKRFEKDLTIWRKLNHINVVPLYGIFYEGTDVYSVSPWMDNGTASDYIGRYPDADRLLIIYQTATGLEYLHRNDIVHGDVRADNILIDGKGNARLSDFGMSKMLQEVGRGSTTAPGFNPRWSAPELLGETASSSKETDVWSFAMACLEVLTGQQPFADIPNDMAVYQKLMRGKHPKRPESSTRVTDPVWALLKKCWEKKPKSRLIISEAKRQIATLHSIPSSSTMTRSPTTDSSLKKRAGRLGFATGTKRRDSNISRVSSRTTDIQIPTITTIIMDEPESITPSTPYPASPNKPPQLQYDITQEFWKIDLDSEGSGVISDYLDRPLTPVSASSATSSEPKNPALPTARSLLTSDSSSRYTTSTQAAVTDNRQIINFRNDGSIASGTLEGFVERLIKRFNFRKDEEFRDILLSSTVDFVSAEEFFSIIERRFREADQATFRNPEDRIAMQHNILTILSYWVVTPHLPLAPQLVWQMRNFCDAAKNQVNSQTMRDKADGIIDSLNQDIRSASLPPPVQGPPMQAADVAPYDLAVGLTILEADKIRQISASDYLLYLGRHPGSNAVEAANCVNDKIVRWAQKFMLHHDNVLQRVDVMTFFLFTAEECLRLRNFASAVAIAKALFSPLLEMLSYTRDQLEEPLKDILRELKELIDPDNNYLNYRKALVDTEMDTNECVPWLTVHLKDLNLVLEKHPATLQVGDNCLINFERYTEFHSQLHQTAPLLNVRFNHLEQYRHHGQLAYVESKLQAIDLDDPIAEAQLREQAERIRIAERSAKKDRVAERKRLGLRRPSKI